MTNDFALFDRGFRLDGQFGQRIRALRGNQIMGAVRRALDLSERQMRALIRAARKEKVRLDVKVGQTTVTIYPTDADDKEAEEDFRL